MGTNFSYEHKSNISVLWMNVTAVSPSISGEKASEKRREMLRTYFISPISIPPGTTRLFSTTRAPCVPTVTRLRENGRRTNEPVAGTDNVRYNDERLE